MDELDARLRAMAKREDWALPAAYESAMDGLEEQIRQGGTLDPVSYTHLDVYKRQV